MFNIIKPNTNFDFVGYRKVWVGFSVLCLVATFILMFTKGINYGIDFTGGAEIQIKAPNGWNISKVRAELEAGGLEDTKVQQIGMDNENSYIIKAQGDEKNLNTVALKVEEILKSKASAGDYSIQRVDVVGPAAGSSLRMSGFLSMLYALICILLYVTLRFDSRYSPGAVIALFHDAMITIGIFILTQKQFDLQILAAILALIGYSNNDTIIVFDRVRETLHNHPNMGIHQAVNRAINETLGRTLLTSIATFLTVFSLWMFGGKVIENFAFTLMIGIVVGAYSSIFIASALVVYMTEWQEKRSGHARSKGKKKSYSVRPEPKFQ
jgi:preprotein translocase subunit SecF